MSTIQKQPYISETKLIILIGLIQFIDILDFMIVMPLGLDYAKALGVDQSKLGLTAVYYTLSAAISGILAATFIDKFERKKALIFVLIGMVCSSFLGGLSSNFETLLLSRFLSGFFGGPATALCFAIIADLVDSKRRGYVIGKVMSAFSFAATLGVPAGLAISRNYSWQAAFFAIAAIGVIVIILISFLLPQMKIHLENKKEISKITYSHLLLKKDYLLAFIFSGIGLMAAFMIIPYISAYLQLNMDFPRKNIELLYITGGIMSFITVQIIGKVIDNNSSSFVIWISNIFIFIFLIFLFIDNYFNLPIPIIYAFFMIGMAMRNVANSTIVSKIPKISDRAGFMLIVSMFQHIASAFGAYLTSIILFQHTLLSPLENMKTVAIVAIALFLIPPFLIKYLEKRLL